MAVDLTGGLGDEREFVFATQPEDPEMRESVNAWIWGSTDDVGMPRIGVEAVADQWDTHEVQIQIAYSDGRVFTLHDNGAVHEPLGSDVAAGLGIWWISGGVYGNMLLGNVYCVPSLTTVWNGTMEDVANHETWAEVIEANPSNRDRFLAQNREEFLATVERWMHAYCACGDPLVPGLTDEEAESMRVPTLVFRSGKSDMFHTRATSEKLAANLPNAQLVEPPWGDREWIERGEARAASGIGLFANWPKLVPQLIDWADETIPA